MKATKLNEKDIRELLTNESNFISGLWDNLDLPVGENNDIDCLKNTGKSSHKKHRGFMLAHNKKSSRAKSLEELHEKLEAMRGKKLRYDGKLERKGLKNRVLKKKKKDVRKLKKNLIKHGANLDSQADTEPKPQKPVYNSEGKMVFSKFDFSESGIKTKVTGRREKEDKLLKRIEKRNEKLKELTKEGELQKASEIKQKISWKRALSKAEGEKVKDDPELLKKSVKNEAKRKQKSKKKWDSRMETMKQRQDERQQKRKDNIQARKKQSKLNKLKKAAKRGRVIPGF